MNRHPDDGLSKVSPGDLPGLTDLERLILYAFIRQHSEIIRTSNPLPGDMVGFGDIKPLLDWLRICERSILNQAFREAKGAL